MDDSKRTGMRARGLDEEGLEEYYRQRNLLKLRVTGEDVARAVMVIFINARQALPAARL